ncbi:hypothetical protein [Microbacterium sp. USTB-Y]|uniref:phosphotriesterase family protein n=1 Tax=Microbacterium sp. USTB-Y TaxID=2823692 RepID=UPI00203AA0DB|nr:hypothetical protein [Microbacterium sp. USTB-Y]
MPRVTAGTATTVLGPRPPAELGPVLPGEHVFGSFSPPWDHARAWTVAKMRRPLTAAERTRYEAALSLPLLTTLTTGSPNRADETLDDEALAVDEVLDASALGIRTIVDATTADRGRSPAALRRLALRTDVNVVMGAGWFHPAWAAGLDRRGVDDVADEIVRELELGVAGVRAGLIGELAPLDPRVPDEALLLTAAGRAARRSGAPVMIRLPADPEARSAVMAAFADEGVPPDRIAFSHSDALAARPDELLSVLEAGCRVLFGRLGRIITADSEADDQEVAAAIVRLAGQGHLERLLVSSGVARAHHLRTYGGSGYAAVPRQFLWILEHFGGGELLPALTTTNPQDWLTIASAALPTSTVTEPRP